MKITENNITNYEANVLNLTLSKKKTIAYIKRYVAKMMDLDIEEYENKSRRREIVTMKQVASYFIRKYIKNISYAVIGQQFNNLDHATILYGIRKVHDLMDSDKNFKNMIEKMNIEIRAYVVSINDTNIYKTIIDLNNLDMLDVSKEKKVIFVGFSNIEMNAYQDFFKANEIKKFENTGLYLCEIVNVEKKQVD
jgi:hypothetical protein